MYEPGKPSINTLVQISLEYIIMQPFLRDRPRLLLFLSDFQFRLKYIVPSVLQISRKCLAEHYTSLFGMSEFNLHCEGHSKIQAGSSPDRVSSEL